MGNPDPASVVEAAMVAIRRRQTRRVLARQSGDSGDHTVVLDAVEAAAGTATVTTVAAALAVDQPRASRLVAAAVRAGLLRRIADQADGRRALLDLTSAGHTHTDAVHAHRREVFDAAMTGWSNTERAEFARLLGRFVAALDEPSETH